MSKLDFEIDRTVREMLDVEQPAGLRGRVIDRISNVPVASAFRRKAWILVPIAAAAIIVLAVMLPWRGDRRVATPSSGATQRPQVVTTTSPPPASVSTTPSSTPTPGSGGAPGVAVARPSRSQQVIRAAVVPDEAGADTTAEDSAQIAALDGPAPLVVEQLTGPPSTSMKSIDVSPIRIAALEVNVLPEVPRERQHEE
jgi:hypothetical protein